MYMNQAYLLSIDGETIPVENHPSIHIEEDFNDICNLVETYGADKIRTVVQIYKQSGQHKNEILDYYCQNWCKVRAWGTFYDEVTFRITSKGLNWYNTIIQFLINHHEYSKSLITVESDKLEGSKKVYWDKITYAQSIDPSNEDILASKLPNYESLIVV